MYIYERPKKIGLVKCLGQPSQKGLYQKSWLYNKALTSHHSLLFPEPTTKAFKTIYRSLTVGSDPAAKGSLGPLLNFCLSVLAQGLGPLRAPEAHLGGKLLSKSDKEACHEEGLGLVYSLITVQRN